MNSCPKRTPAKSAMRWQDSKLQRKPDPFGGRCQRSRAIGRILWYNAWVLGCSPQMVPFPTQLDIWLATVLGGLLRHHPITDIEVQSAIMHAVRRPVAQ